MGKGLSFRDYDPNAARGDLHHCSYTQQWVQFSPILNQRYMEQWPVWTNYYSNWPLFLTEADGGLLFSREIHSHVLEVRFREQLTGGRYI